MPGAFKAMRSSAQYPYSLTESAREKTAALTMLCQRDVPEFNVQFTIFNSCCSAACKLVSQSLFRVSPDGLKNSEYAIERHYTK